MSEKKKVRFIKNHVNRIKKGDVESYDIGRAVYLVSVKAAEYVIDEPKKEDKKHEQGRFLRREFSYTRFQQTLILPDDADTDKIEAKVKHGVLHIDIPKKPHSNEHKENRMIAIG